MSLQPLPENVSSEPSKHCFRCPVTCNPLLRGCRSGPARAPWTSRSKEGHAARGSHLADGKVGLGLQPAPQRRKPGGRPAGLFGVRPSRSGDARRLILVVQRSGRCAELRERARVLGAGDKVFFAGSLTRDDLSLCFSVCKAFVSASDSITMAGCPDRGHRQRPAGHLAASQRKCGPDHQRRQRLFL